MECNKEEAMRAKSIAVKKMLTDDFSGARKIVLKAQQLFPDLENVSQMLTVCEVHCSAGDKINGEMDWYGILQVGQTADELTIKKQFRKLALLLHPDKNKFGGAEAAFKLVGEAHRTLTDKAKRGLHDMKRAASYRHFSARQPTQRQPPQNRTLFTNKQPGVVNGNGLNQQQQSTRSPSAQTFWTLCPACGIRYQYYMDILNRALRCQSCKKPFVAYDLNVPPAPSAPSAPSAAPWNRAGFPQPVPPAHFAAGKKTNFGSGSTMGNVRGGGSAASKPCSRPGLNAELGGGPSNNSKEGVEVGDLKFDKVKLQEASKNEQAAKASAGSRSQKRGRKSAVESIESESSDSDVIVDGVCPSRQNTGTAGSNPRRSTRPKQNISYNEDKSDHNFGSPNCKKFRMGTSSDAEDVDVEIQGGDTSGKNVPASGIAASTGKNGSKRNKGPLGSSPNGWCQTKEEPEINDGVDSSSEASPEPFSYPDPEFCDFEKERNESIFAADQIWAVYDNVDAMPRYYALIRQIYGKKFKLRFNWLEYDPTCKAETLWYKGGLPVGCGNFKLGKSENTQERLMFSHLMPLRKGTKRNSYDIVPRKGEVWALFKNWDVKWGFCVDRDRQYEYEIVEVLSDFMDDVISVVRLVRVQDFVSLFVQDADSGSIPFEIPMKNILQFSHKVPAYRLIGDEREGIPKGSLELDCASLPTNFREMFPSISLACAKPKVEDLDTTCNGFHFKSEENKDTTPKTNKSSCELNGKKPLEEVQRSIDTSYHKEHIDSKVKANHSSTSKSTSVESENHVKSEYMTPKQEFVTEEEKVDANATSKAATPSSSPNWYEYPDAEFHSFENERTIEKFEAGQIWALYSDINKYPNYYGMISKVEVDGLNFKVHVSWLEGYSDKENEREWISEQLPVGCGTFKIVRENFICDSMDTFSHLVSAQLGSRKNHYIIHPCVGEIWAVYKNWRVGWSLSDLDNCEFDVAEIIGVSSLGFQVSVLTKVNGHRAVFKQEKRVAGGILNIPLTERFKFSHRIPTFKLTGERDGKLRGYWELDPAAAPDLLLFTNAD